MRSAELARFEPLYRAARYYGAGDILRRHLGVGADYVVPLSLCHGVDFGQSREPCDVHGVEPIYWACHADMHDRAKRIKPSVAIPHPFLLAAEAGLKTEQLLVIGPPPGQDNDRRLLSALRAEGIAGGSILVKKRFGWQGSNAFWSENGFVPLTLGDPATYTYADMARFFGRFREVVGCTVSSAVVFAAAIGADVHLLRNYHFTAYELLSAEHILDTGTDMARQFILTLVGGDQEAKVRASRSFLGAELDATPREMRAAIEEAIATLQMPVYFQERLPRLAAWLLQEAALRLDRPGLIATPLRDRLRYGRPRVGVMRMNEVDFWINGKNGANYSITRMPFVPGVTVPGNPPDPY